MRQIFQIRLKLILITAFLVTVTSFTVTAQTSFAEPSLAIQPVQNGAVTGQKSDALDICEQRLLKTLDALDQAKQLLVFKDAEIEARKRVDAVTNELLKIKDLIIAEQEKLINVLSKKDKSLWGKIKKLLALAEKIALIAVGVYVGKGL